MTAAVYLDLDQLFFAINGVRHRPVRLRAVPQSGEAVRMLCGVVAAVEYASRTPDTAPMTICPTCDREYRAMLGIPQYTARSSPPPPRTGR